MSELNIIKLNSGDTQENLIGKINQNFDSLVNSGGGPRGTKGYIGKRGSIGDGGGIGDVGQQGTRGTRWFIGANEPTGGNNDPIYYGDYWVNSIGDNNIFQYSSSGWTSTGYNLKASEVFKVIENIQGGSGNKNAIVFNTPFPNLNTLVLSDATLTTANPTYSKLLISTNGTNDYPLIEFSKINATDPGTPSEYTRRPHFRWLSPTSTEYGLLLNIPQDDFSISVGGNLTFNSTAGTLSISGNAGMTLTSGNNMSIVSNGSMLLSAGSNTMEFASQNFQVNSDLFSVTVPINITTTTSLPGLVIANTGNGSGLWLSAVSNSSSYYLGNFISASTSKFGIRNDGRINVSRIINLYSDLAEAASTSSIGTYNAYSESTTNVEWWIVGLTGDNSMRSGNTIYADFALSTSTRRGISIPLGNSISSWDNYLDLGQSINLRVFAANGKEIDDLGVNKYGTPPRPNNNIITYRHFDTAVKFIDITILKTSAGTGVGASIVHYHTCNGDSGYLFTI